jgi:MerR family transcriptional regulator, repressor of the yfmOP operon
MIDGVAVAHPPFLEVARMSTATSRSLRIGEAAARLGTTPRTIRYYEEIGLLSGAAARRDGAHRTYTEAEVERIAEILRLKELLGLSLEAVRGILEAQDARRLLRARFERTEDPDEQREILTSALGHIDRQLALVRERVQQLGRFEADLESKRERARSLLADLR